MNILRATILMMVLLQGNVLADEYTLSLQPTLSKKVTIAAYQPLADYLSQKTGHTITIKTYRSFFTYWQKIRKAQDVDLVLDAAHFTGYRLLSHDYTVLAKIPGMVSYSLVIRKDSPVTRPEDLVLKNIATMPSPSLGGIRLYEIFDDPSRLPREVTVNSHDDAIMALTDGRADAAIIPTPLVGHYDFLEVIQETQAAPHMALSASPKVPQDVRQNITRALTDAHNTDDGRLMLSQAGISNFVGTTAEEYTAYSELLKDAFGYIPSIASIPAR